MVREMKHTEIGEIPAEWKLQTFEETLCVLSNNTLPRADLNDRGGTVRNVHYGDILTRFGEVLDCEKDEVPYLNDISLLTASAQVLQDGDVILADTAEDDTVGKATEIYGLGKGRMVAGLHTIPCRVKKGAFVPKWLGYYMNSPIYHDQVLPYVTGIKVSSISKTAISDTLIAVPPLEEQRAIVSALSEVDQLLAELKKVASKLRDFKRGCLYLMFPQEDSDVPQMREPGYTGPWQQRKLGNVAIEFKSGAFLRADEIEVNGEYPVYGGNGLRGYTSTYNHDGEFALIGRQGALCGNMTYSAGKAYFTEHAVVVQADENNDTRFIYYLLDTMQLGQYSDQSAQPGLAVNKLIKLDNMFPDKLEQIRISTYFSSLDHLITLHQQKFDKYTQIKKAMMSELITGKIKLV